MTTFFDMECEPNESFYRSIDREYERKKYKTDVELKFDNLSINNDYDVYYIVKHRGNKYQATIKILDNKGMMLYCLLSDISKGEEQALLNVKAKIVRQAKLIVESGRKTIDKRLEGKEDEELVMILDEKL